MTACLSDYTLWSLSEGHGTAEEREHLEHCRLCAGRSGRMAGDLRAIVGVLRSEPPPASRPEPARLPSLPLLAAAAAVVLAVGISLLPLRSPVPTAAPPADGVAALGQLSSDVFDDGELVSAPSAADDVVYALSAAAPCEWQPEGCRDIGQPLF